MGEQELGIGVVLVPVLSLVRVRVVLVSLEGHIGVVLVPLASVGHIGVVLVRFATVRSGKDPPARPEGFSSQAASLAARAMSRRKEIEGNLAKKIPYETLL